MLNDGFSEYTSSVTYFIGVILVIATVTLRPILYEVGLVHFTACSPEAKDLTFVAQVQVLLTGLDKKCC